MRTSVYLGPELQNIKAKAGDYGFSKRLNVMAERYQHIIRTAGQIAISGDTVDVLKAVPGIATMRASKVEHLPALIKENPPKGFSKGVIEVAVIELRSLPLLSRLVMIEVCVNGQQ